MSSPSRCARKRRSPRHYRRCSLSFRGGDEAVGARRRGRDLRGGGPPVPRAGLAKDAWASLRSGQAIRRAAPCAVHRPHPSKRRPEPWSRHRRTDRRAGDGRTRAPGSLTHPFDSACSTTSTGLWTGSIEPPRLMPPTTAKPPFSGRPSTSNINPAPPCTSTLSRSRCQVGLMTQVRREAPPRCRGPAARIPAD